MCRKTCLYHPMGKRHQEEGLYHPINTTTGALTASGEEVNALA